MDMILKELKFYIIYMLWYESNNWKIHEYLAYIALSLCLSLVSIYNQIDGLSSLKRKRLLA